MRPGDTDGPFGHGRVIAPTSPEENDAWRLTPNPVARDERAYLQIFSTGYRQYRVSIYDLRGRELSWRVRKVEKELNNLAVNENLILVSGVCVVQVCSADGTG